MRYTFITGTRADFGKLKNVINELKVNRENKINIVATGMHLIKEFGQTGLEIKKLFPNYYIPIEGQRFNESMNVGFSRFMVNFEKYLLKSQTDLVIVHGDRFDALGASIVATNNNIHVAHIEGGEVSGTIDEAIRHSVSKFSHLHFVSNDESKKRVLRLGENPNHIHITGSPETDILLSSNLPTKKETFLRYDIDFDKYCIFCFHPVTSELKNTKSYIREIIEFAKLIKKQIIWIYPNNDNGSNIIIEEIKKIISPRIKFFESLRFEHYITLLKNCEMIVGNSSSGVREAPVFGIPCINLGSRQSGRVKSNIIFDTDIDIKKMQEAYEKISISNSRPKNFKFGKGNVAKNITEILNKIDLKQVPIQKKFYE